MGKKQAVGVLNRLKGKKLVFSGKFEYGVEEALKAMAVAQQGSICDDVDAGTDYLVLADLNAGKTIQKKVMSLNGKGGTIQVIDGDAFNQLAEPTAEEVLALLRANDAEAYAKIFGWIGRYRHSVAPTTKLHFHSENLKGVKLHGADLEGIEFENCNFTGAQLNRLALATAIGCDFSQVTGMHSRFGDVRGSRFAGAVLENPRFDGDFSEAYLNGASLESAIFTGPDYYYHPQQRKRTPLIAVQFNKAKLKSATFVGVDLKAPDFRGADLTKATFQNGAIEPGNFQGAILSGAVLVGYRFADCDFSNADLTSANLAGADLTGSNFAGADLKNANLRGAKLDRADLSKAKNYDPNSRTAGTIGPALKELDTVNSGAKRIQLSFRVKSAADEEGDEVSIDSSGLQYGWGVRVPGNLALRSALRMNSKLSFSDAMLQLANVAGHLQARYETVDVSSTKSPKGGKELRELVLRGIAEAFAQDLPAEEELAAATKTYRDAEREKGAADREAREHAKAEAAKEKEKAKKQIAKQIQKTVGKVNDVATFLKALELRIEKPKIDKATKMLKASGFKLFNDVTDEHVSGVVKSQTDADLVYACRVALDGQYSCCTQNLNVCGGLRGSICKHLLVLIIGLVQAGELDPETIDAWIAKTHSVKPELDKETMGAIFIKYKGAEAGEVDWRPTETVPEDYYAL